MSHLGHILHSGSHVFHHVPIASGGFVLGGFLGYQSLVPASNPDFSRCDPGFISSSTQTLDSCTANLWGLNMWGLVGSVDPLVGAVVGGIIGGLFGLLIYQLARAWDLARKSGA
jgi:hypothetical protein